MAEIDLGTFRRLPWERNIPLFLARLSLFDGTRLDPDPRTLLKSVLDKVEAKGWQGMSGAEFEYFQFNETPKSLAQKGYTRLDALTPGSEYLFTGGTMWTRRWRERVWSGRTTGVTEDV